VRRLLVAVRIASVRVGFAVGRRLRGRPPIVLATAHANVLMGNLAAIGAELARRGIPAFGFEVGEGGRIDEACIARGWEGVQNLMRHLGMLPGEHRAEPAPRVVSSMTAVRTQRGGLWSCDVPLGAEVAAGDTIGTVTTPWGEQVDELVSPHGGPLMRLTTFASVAGSDRIAQIGVEAS